MNLDELLPKEDTVVAELSYKGEKLVNDDGSVMTVEVYLPHSKPYRTAKHKQNDFYLNLGDGVRPASETMEDRGLEFLSEITKSWNITTGGEQPKLTKKKAKEVFYTFPFITETLLEKVNSVEAFT